MLDTQQERLAYLIQSMWEERYGDKPLDFPDTDEAQWECYRGLANIRPPEPVSAEYIDVQDAYLSTLNNQQDLTRLNDLDPILGTQLYLWQGDITTLKVDGIVNAANSRFLGCMQANHDCIDNIIHTKAGVQLRLDCAKIIEEQGRKEGVGKAKITPAYNLPSNYVLHTVGPQIRKRPVSQMNKDLLARCYRSCLELADEHGLRHLAFCSISTGVFGFPQEEACRIAIDTTMTYLRETDSSINVIFNVFSDKDWALYKEAFDQYDK
ncbi:protein-ADP-ribose hydrolase [Staphylococcus devriesei]|uniref:Protein-ADP-ribose hydrolase n=1 Tax=Staphylococcus devriesei TaxID=586733 RepID=A0A2K4DVN7_9STAP|nr:protein-ADP-ribose hydrolase [Staphylococcus devriesei]MCE5090477.1 protein-ADP-ribose hydrolase [Staphylococcus devriesei]MCE5097183.1 protein-ADP-ribose hydrolase [Staphylococcus devriesei]PNZ90524.1 hypothetical protein CD147_00900 [Staphylococcus devriesei]PTE74604.1 protein-ADP-ribose hydrolase [Staphylococcus devriesei]PTF05043.1 protein-ADP-ribose hydrolase [Staphylococcus devriesei]